MSEEGWGEGVGRREEREVSDWRKRWTAATSRARAGRWGGDEIGVEEVEVEVEEMEDEGEVGGVL